MKPIEFPEQNAGFGQGQPQYGFLPAYQTPEGEVISCWELEEGELEHIAKTGQVWLRMLSNNQPLQAVVMQVESPFYHHQAQACSEPPASALDMARLSEAADPKQLTQCGE